MKSMDWTALLLVAFFFLVTVPSEGKDQGMVLDPKIKAAPLEKSMRVPPEKWSNPSITIYDNAVAVRWNKRQKHKELQPEEVESFLVDLPVSAWPYGRIIVVTECGPSSGTKESEHYRKRSWGVIVGAMRRLKVAVDAVPSA
jgi:hypothetical protein